MDIRELRYFLAVVREQNITKAAEVLHITQPTLSRQMSQLEQELSTQLFVRGRVLTLTDAGILLRRRAEEVVDLMDKVQGEFAEPEDISGLISIGCGGLASSEILTQAMRLFYKQYPRVRFDVYTNSAEFIKERMDKGILDFGLLLEPVEIEKYEYIRLPDKEKWGIFMHRSHPLAHQSVITREDLKGEPLITTSRSSIQKELAEWFGNSFSRLHIIATYNIITNIASYINTGEACALTLEGAVGMFDQSKYVFCPLDPPLEMTSVLAWKKFQPGFSAAGHFLEFVKSMPEMNRSI